MKITFLNNKQIDKICNSNILFDNFKGFLDLKKQVDHQA